MERHREGSNLVSLEHSLVNNLLQLDVVEVRPNHHLQHLEKLAVRDDWRLASDRHLDGETEGPRTSVIVDIVDAEGNYICEQGAGGARGGGVQRSFASLFSFEEKMESAEMNSLNSISSSLLVSKMAITRSSSGFEANSGMERNSSVVRVPEPSLSSFLKRLYNRFSSSSETASESDRRLRWSRCKAAAGRAYSST